MSKIFDSFCLYVTSVDLVTHLVTLKKESWVQNLKYATLQTKLNNTHTLRALRSPQLPLPMHSTQHNRIYLNLPETGLFFVAHSCYIVTVKSFYVLEKFAWIKFSDSQKNYLKKLKWL